MEIYLAQHTVYFELNNIEANLQKKITGLSQSPWVLFNLCILKNFFKHLIKCL